MCKDKLARYYRKEGFSKRKRPNDISLREKVKCVHVMIRKRKGCFIMAVPTWKPLRGRHFILTPLYVRWIRNRISNSTGLTNSVLCTKEDLDWIIEFLLLEFMQWDVFKKRDKAETILLWWIKQVKNVKTKFLIYYSSVQT